jgi:ABC-type Na+ efflux pump permease subunit
MSRGPHKEWTMTGNTEGRTPSGLRIVWAIAWKDIVDAVKSMTTASVILGTMVVILGSQAMPMLLSRSVALSVAVYDPGETRLAEALDAGDGVQVVRADSMADLHASVVQSPLKRIGVELPPDIDVALGSGAAVSLEGYVAWADRGQAEVLAEGLEQAIAAAGSGAGDVTVEVRLAYPDAESAATSGLLHSSLVVQLLVVGVSVVSYLIFDEKEAKTMDALLVSPANAGQIVAGKVIAGLFYCAVAASAALLIGWRSVVHWDVMLASTAAITLAAVSLGLLAGMLFESGQQMGLWFVVPFLLLLAGVVAKAIASRLPPVLAVLLGLLPTAAGLEAMALAMAGDASLGDALPQLGVVLAWALAALAAVAARLRRMDR